MSGQNCREPSSSDDGLPTSDTNCSFDSPVESVFRGAVLFDTGSVQKTDELDLPRLLLQNSNNPPTYAQIIRWLKRRILLAPAKHGPALLSTTLGRASGRSIPGGQGWTPIETCTSANCIG